MSRMESRLSSLIGICMSVLLICTILADANETYMLTSLNSTWDKACFGNGPAVIDGIQFYPMKFPPNLSSTIGAARAWIGYYQRFGYFNLVGCLSVNAESSLILIDNTPGRCATACGSCNYIGLEDNICHCLNVTEIGTSHFKNAVTCSRKMCNGTQFFCGTRGQMWVYVVNNGNTARLDQLPTSSNNENRCLSAHYKLWSGGAGWRFSSCLDHHKSLCELNNTILDYDTDGLRSLTSWYEAALNCFNKSETPARFDYDNFKHYHIQDFNEAWTACIRDEVIQKKGLELIPEVRIRCLSLSVADGKPELHLENCEDNLPAVCPPAVATDTYMLKSLNSTWDKACFGNGPAVIDGIQFYPMKFPPNLSSTIGAARAWIGYYQRFGYFNLVGCLSVNAESSLILIDNTPGRCATACGSCNYIGLEDNICHCLNETVIGTSHFKNAVMCSTKMCSGTHFFCGTRGQMWVYGVKNGNTARLDQLATSSNNENRCLSAQYKMYSGGADWKFSSCLDHHKSLCELNNTVLDYATYEVSSQASWDEAALNCLNKSKTPARFDYDNWRHYQIQDFNESWTAYIRDEVIQKKGLESIPDGRIRCLSLSVSDGQPELHLEDCEDNLPAVCLAGIMPRTTTTTTTTPAATTTRIIASIRSTSSADMKKPTSSTSIGIDQSSGSTQALPANKSAIINYAPSKPHVSFAAIGTQSIQVTITIVDALATSYEITGTPIIGGNEVIDNGTFPPNLNTSVHVFTSDNEPGTCFNFRIIAISGYGSGAQRSEPVAASGICYDSSKPNVNIIPESIQSIEVTITKGDGQAISYEIIGTPVTGGDVSIQNGTFRSTETSISHNFTTSDLPGTCFDLQIRAISGSGQWAGRSEPVVKNDVCYVTGPISRPLVQPDIKRLPAGKNQLVFYCDFEPSSDPTVVYIVRWYMDRIDEGTLLTSSTHLNYSSKETFRSTTLLSERNITLGITLFCTVSAKKLDITVPSEPYFAGFKITPGDAVNIQDSEEATLYIQSTVPFSCVDMNEECFLNVNMLYRETGADNCVLPAAAAFISCGVRISSRRWNETHTLRIGVRHAQNLHSISRIYHIKFKTDENFGYHEMFRNYTIPLEIQVKVSTDTSDLNGKECHAISDPHMLTFDGRYYENQNNGTYILYKHSTKLTQVQMKTSLCYGIPQGPPFCPCGVAIAAGRDVFVIDRCSTPIKIYMPRCDDGTLKGKVKSDGKSYQIHLPTGSLVKINAGISFNIYLYPSVSDRRATSGLCGYLDNDQNNDFNLRDGSWVPENEFEAFNSNWEVNPEENLFNISNYKSLQMWPKEMNMCICGQYQGGHNGQSDNCSPDSRNFCPDNSLNDSLAAMCNGLLMDDPWATVDLDQSDHNVSRSNINTKTEIPSMRNYTENSASIECWSFLNSSKLFKKCSEIPDLDPSSFAKTCAKDAIITHTMNWAPTHLDSAQKSCLYQVKVHQPLKQDLLEKYNASVIENRSVDSRNRTRKGTDKYTPDLQKLIEQLACHMDCSGHGICWNGTCYCEGTFGDDDCSVDLREPPLVYGIPDRGICDLQTKGCENVSVLGNNFVESKKLSCRLTLFKIKVNGTIIQDTKSYITKGKRISFAEVSCNIEDVRSKRSVQFSDDLDTVAIVYGVAVSNNNKNFSQDTSLLLYDSLCLDCTKAGFNIGCKLKEGFDLENRKCNKKVTPSTPTDMESKQVMIIAAAMGSALVLLVSLVLVCCVIQRRKSKQYKKEQREKEYQELQEIERKKEYYGITEDVYDQIKDEQDTYYIIPDNSLNTNESKESEERYVKLGTAKNAETNEYSSLSKALQHECISDGEKPDIPYRPITLPKVTIATDANPI